MTYYGKVVCGLAGKEVAHLGSECLGSCLKHKTQPRSLNPTAMALNPKPYKPDRP